jgi:hypothetical protein
MSPKLSNRVAIYVIYALVLLVAVPFSSTLLFFLAIDQSSSFRHRLNPEWIRYYALKDRYKQDKNLVFIPKYAGTTFSWETRGDLYSPLYNVEVKPMKSTWSYTQDGFRKNSSNGSTDLLVIGDSFIEVGETDSDTLSEPHRKQVWPPSIWEEGGMDPFNTLSFLDGTPLKLNHHAPCCRSTMAMTQKKWKCMKGGLMEALTMTGRHLSLP